MSGGRVSRRRFLGAAALASSLMAAEGVAAQPDGEPPSRSARAPEDGADQDGSEKGAPLRADATVTLRDGPFDLALEARPADVVVTTYRNGQIGATFQMDRGGSVAIDLEPDVAERLADVLSQAAESARDDGEYWTSRS